MTLASSVLAFGLAVVALGPPTAYAATEAISVNAEPIVRADSNVLVVSSDNLLTWNGVPITLAELDELATESAAMQPEPSLEFRPDVDVDYEFVAEVLRIVAESGVRKFGFIGNEKVRDNSVED